MSSALYTLQTTCEKLHVTCERVAIFITACKLNHCTIIVVRSERAHTYFALLLTTHTFALLSACRDIPELAASDMMATFYTHTIIL